MTRWDKAALRDELLLALRAQLESAQRAHSASVEGATHEEAKPENEKDTRALEQSYLARGQAQRLMELREGVSLVQTTPVGNLGSHARCSLGAVVELEFDSEVETYWLAPAGGGTRLAQGSIQVITPKSPLGRALIGANVGDCCEAQIGGIIRELELVGFY